VSCARYASAAPVRDANCTLTDSSGSLECAATNAATALARCCFSSRLRAFNGESMNFTDMRSPFTTFTSTTFSWNSVAI